MQALHEKVADPPGTLANAAVYMLTPEVADSAGTVDQPPAHSLSASLRAACPSWLLIAAAQLDKGRSYGNDSRRCPALASSAASMALADLPACRDVRWGSISTSCVVATASLRPDN